MVWFRYGLGMVRFGLDSFVDGLDQYGVDPVIFGFGMVWIWYGFVYGSLDSERFG